MTDLVLDASASVDLLLDTATGRRLQPMLPAGAHWLVPEHFFAEVAGALRRAELRGGVLSARAAQAMTSLSTAPLRRVAVSGPPQVEQSRHPYRPRGQLTHRHRFGAVSVDADDDVGVVCEHGHAFLPSVG